MKISVTKRHIDAGKLSNGISPIELAIMDLDCFEDVQLRADDATGYLLEIDGLHVTLARHVQKALISFFEKQEMNPISFDLPVDNGQGFSDDDFLLEALNDDEEDFGFSEFAGGDLDFGYYS